jgi:hypothetical protein
VALTDKEILGLKPQAKKFKVFDGDGLYLLVHPKGGKYWYMKYHLASRPQEIAFGTYPAVSLKLARERRDEARQQLARGLNPRLEKKVAKEARTVFFAGVAEEWVQMISGRARPEGGHERVDRQASYGSKRSVLSMLLRKSRCRIICMK